MGEWCSRERGGLMRVGCLDMVVLCGGSWEIKLARGFLKEVLVGERGYVVAEEQGRAESAKIAEEPPLPTGSNV